MRNVSLFIILAAASLSVGAQQQQKQPPQPQNGANAPDKELVERARADGSAGGTAPVPPERRKAVGAGAGPHLEHNAPSPQKLPKDEPVVPPK
jgi:hypothetical protein